MRGQLVEPGGELRKVPVLDDLDRIVLEYPMVEADRQYILELVDALYALAISQLLQCRDAVAHPCEIDSHRLQLQLLARLAGNRVKVFVAVISPRAGIVRQQRDR